MDKEKILIDVPYLQEQDVKDNGDLQPSVCKGLPTLLLVQANFCPHCTHAKPDFQRLLDSKNKFTIVTIQGDGDSSDKAAYQKLSRNVAGFPTYLVFGKDGVYKGVCEVGRDHASLKKYMMQL
jgi:thiol-disulfide isomerase/thioredoxin